MVWVVLIGLVVSSILTWAVDTGAGVYGTFWAVTGVSLLLALPVNVVGAILRLLMSFLGGSCLGVVLALIMTLAASLLWGLNMEKHMWYAAVPAYIVGTLIGMAVLFAVSAGDE